MYLYSYYAIFACKFIRLFGKEKAERHTRRERESLKQEGEMRDADPWI